MIVGLKSGSVLSPTAMGNPDVLGAFHFVKHERGARNFARSGTSSLSIKSFTNCEAHYAIGNARYRVDDSSYLVINAGQDYSISVEAGKPGEAFCVFFEDGFAEDVHHCVAHKAGYLLDNPERSSRAQIRCFEKTYPHDAVLSPVLNSFKANLAARAGDAAWIYEQLHEVMGRVLAVQNGAFAQADSLSSLRPSTREELYRRITRAMDYMNACLDQKVSLDDIARVACLSPNHLLRTFKEVVCCTPHQFLTEIRMRRASQLLLRDDISVYEVALAVGFESPGSFGNLFRRTFGYSPGRHRPRKKVIPERNPRSAQ